MKMQPGVTQANQMKNDVVHIHDCAIKNANTTTWLGCTFPNVCGTAAMVTKMVWNGADRVLSLLPNSSKQTLCQYHNIAGYFFNPPPPLFFFYKSLMAPDGIIEVVQSGKVRGSPTC